ncbi:MAG: two-component regulator propeller domain-containing protein [Ferruginibacter sp.]
MNKILLAIILFFSFFTSLNAQSKYLSGNYWIENYTKKDGLPENIIIDIMQDRKGYMWMITPYSLVRFDGIQFKTFSTRKQFPDLYVHFYSGMAEDNDGILWIPTINKGLFSFDPRTQQFRNFPYGIKANNISDTRINDIVADKSGNIWIGTFNGLNLLTKKNDSISIHQFNMDYQNALGKFIDTYISNQQPIGGLAKLGDYEKKTCELEVKETSRFVLACMGESNQELVDYGWIENEKGTKIWSMDVSKCLYAGGDGKNKLQIEVITLVPGKYKIAYVSDDSHSWNNWNATAPLRPDLWGIQLFKLPQQSIDKIENQINNWLKNPSYAAISAMKKDSAENLWALDYTNLIKINTKASLNGKLSLERIPLPATFIPGNSLCILENDRLLIMGHIYHKENNTTTIASVIYDDRKKTAVLNDQGLSLMPSSQANALVRDRNKNYWMGTFNNAGDGLFISEAGNDVPTFRKFEFNDTASTKTGINNYEQIWTIYEDRSGYIWMGSRQTGLYKIRTRKTPFQYTRVTVPGSDNIKLAITAIADDPAGNIWLAAKDNGIFKYDRRSRQTVHYPETNKQAEDPFFFNGTGNTLIIPGTYHTRQYIPGSEGLSSFPIHVPDSLYLVTADNYGNYWAIVKNSLLGPNHLLQVYNGTGFHPVSFDSTIFQYGGIRNFNICPNGNIWICPPFEGAQLYRFDNKTKKLHFVKRYLPEGTDVYDVIEDEKGIVWVGTYSDGLIRLDPKTNTTKYFTKAEGLPSNYVSKMVLVKNRLWVITDLGTAFLNIADESIRINKDLDEFILQNVRRSFAFSFQDIGMRPSVFTTHAGEIAMIAKSGFCILDPNDLVLDTVKPILHITALKIGGRDFDIEKLMSGIDFGYNQNNLEIGYIGLHYDQAAKNKYSYFLKGANEQWVLAGHERIARYSNLSPGHYEFYLKASNADGIWSAERKMFSFTILPPWWKTWWAYSLYVLVIGVVVWLYIVYRSRRLKQENILLEAKVEHRTQQLHHSLENLKSAQAQLIQSEKMASLGELTAGIAHEIQNPLNFVNNFSEVNNELIEELKSQKSKLKSEEQDEILNDIFQNNEKINHHGKRADAIVKGMLQHSRSSSGQKEPTDINALCDEYLRLSYHGLRAKDKSFNATIKTDFDKSIEKINIIPQDFGRVMLNLLNNAFYAVAEKKKQKSLLTPPERIGINSGETSASANEVYEPIVTVTTRRLSPASGGWGAEITVTDNGNGIPSSVKEKIFQPFFTTKPTGQGTGLGLSLAYDIVKAHGGELMVETKEKEGSIFKITLPA